MISIYKTIEDDMVVLDKIEEGCWISAIHPNEEDLAFLEEETPRVNRNKRRKRQPAAAPIEVAEGGEISRRQRRMKEDEGPKRHSV